jgi:hypothetical protein
MGRIWYAQMKDVLAADDGNPLTVAPLQELGTRLRALSEETYKRRGGRGATLPGRGAVAGAGRVDLRLAEDNDGELYALTKGDGMIRALVSVKIALAPAELESFRSSRAAGSATSGQP